MVANAMAIARREIESGDEHLVQELVRLAGIFREEPPSVSDTTTLVRELERLNRRLAADQFGDRLSDLGEFGQGAGEQISLAAPALLERRDMGPRHFFDMAK